MFVTKVRNSKPTIWMPEAAAQLRHDAGERQVASARTTVVTTGGGTPSGVMLLQRDGASERGGGGCSSDSDGNDDPDELVHSAFSSETQNT